MEMNEKISKPIVIEMANLEDSTTIHRLMEKVYNNMPDKRLFFCDDLEYVEKHIEKEGFAVKAVCENVIVASLIARFPKSAEDNLGYDVEGIAESDFDKIAHLESVVVDEEFRGLGLQDRMIKFAEKIIADKGYTYIMATVSPDNKYSLKNFERNGYKMVKVKKKYGEMLRAIVLKGDKKWDL